MKLHLKLKDGREYFFNEKQTDIIAKNLNYVRIIQLILGDKDILSDTTIDIMNEKISFGNIKSLELIF
ncbi:hypothetical protein CLTEP_06420 [Clostridium tepidiprofundi DSM 19306]|uniref:Uncharacterized protein n=1 Tax=Clostridium tepidiprofundi DSM 19306 TaxID=1121338 RepID=A0A151B6D4_9CLOT|nr:hypothetical protein [Clostridium tepidiprofundi]KYH35466.1 hypothetical protein CLTEP_06420 [Clostridium tepidiprofundi DSM 19306]